MNTVCIIRIIKHSTKHTYSHTHIYIKHSASNHEGEVTQTPCEHVWPVVQLVHVPTPSPLHKIVLVFAQLQIAVPLRAIEHKL